MQYNISAKQARMNFIYVYIENLRDIELFKKAEQHVREQGSIPWEEIEKRLAIDE